MSISFITKGFISEKVVGEAQEPYIFAIAVDIDIPGIDVSVDVPVPPAVNVAMPDPIFIAVGVEQPQVTVFVDEDTIGVEV